MTSVQEIKYALATQFAFSESGSACSVKGSQSAVLSAFQNNNNIPIDNPKTIPDLSPIHEVMVKDFSGNGTGLLNLTSRLSLCLFWVIMGTLFLPHNFDPRVWAVFLIPAVILIAGIIYSVNNISVTEIQDNKIKF